MNLKFQNEAVFWMTGHDWRMPNVTGKCYTTNRAASGSTAQVGIEGIQVWLPVFQEELRGCVADGLVSGDLGGFFQDFDHGFYSFLSFQLQLLFEGDDELSRVFADGSI